MIVRPGIVQGTFLHAEVHPAPSPKSLGQSYCANWDCKARVRTSIFMGKNAKVGKNAKGRHLNLSPPRHPPHAVPPVPCTPCGYCRQDRCKAVWQLCRDQQGSPSVPQGIPTGEVEVPHLPAVSTGLMETRLWNLQTVGQQGMVCKPHSV